ncbi:sigma-70 family RNA polymerase sigma factor [bacterium]|nr:sigma-70 family RNA polymerase sigma factor [bacterium]
MCDRKGIFFRIELNHSVVSAFFLTVNPRKENWIEFLPAARLQSSDAWDGLFHRFQLPLFTFVVELVQQREVALEIVQESFLNATRHIETLKADKRFDSWLFSIARQKVQIHWRKTGKEKSLKESLLDQQGGDMPMELGPDETLIADELRETFFLKLDALPEAMKSVLLLHYLEEFSVRDIADILKLPEGTVKSRLYHARLRLRTELQSTQSS